MNSVFNEEQKFRQWWLWVILIILALIPFFGIYIQIFEGKNFGNKPMSDNGLIVNAVIAFVLIFFIWTARLKTHIDEKGIRVKLWPFGKKNIAWSEVKSATVIQYGFIGGWGIRLWTKYGTVYNASGDKGLAIELKNGKKYLIGTQQETELKKHIARISPN